MHQSVEGGAVDAEDFRGLDALAASFLERDQDAVTGGSVEKGLQAAGFRGRLACVLEQQVFDTEFAARREHHAAFDRVFEFADVAGPGVAEQAGLDVSCPAAEVAFESLVPSGEKMAR